MAWPGTIATNSTCPRHRRAVATARARCFQGAMDDVRLYNRALSAGEIAALAIRRQPGPGRGQRQLLHGSRARRSTSPPRAFSATTATPTGTR